MAKRIVKVVVTYRYEHEVEVREAPPQPPPPPPTPPPAPLLRLTAGAPPLLSRRRGFNVKLARWKQALAKARERGFEGKLRKDGPLYVEAKRIFDELNAFGYVDEVDCCFDGYEVPS